MNSYRGTLLENASATGAAVKWPGGRGVFMAEATWGGGSVKLQMQTPNGTFVDIDGASLTANGTKAFDAPAGFIKAVVATATAVYAYAATLA